MTAETSEVVKTGLQLSSIIAHVKENNVAYLVALLLAHSIGLVAEAQTYAAGVC